jgi:hypothetical protein
VNKKTKLENRILIVEQTFQKPDHSITGLKKRLENDHSKTGRSRFQMLTVFVFFKLWPPRALLSMIYDTMFTIQIQQRGKDLRDEID